MHRRVPIVIDLVPVRVLRRRRDAELLLRAALGWILLAALWRWV